MQRDEDLPAPALFREMELLTDRLHIGTEGGLDGFRFKAWKRVSMTVSDLGMPFSYFFEARDPIQQAGPEGTTHDG